MTSMKSNALLTAEDNKSGEADGAGAIRRRSVHFDACPPTTVVVSHHHSSEEADDEDEEEDDVKAKDKAACLMPPPSLTLNMASSRRKSAPASAIRQALRQSSEDDVDPAADLSETLKALDPELRHSFTKLRCTRLENPEGDFEALKHKLVGRDELEIYRIKQMRRASKIAASTIAANAAKDEIREIEEEEDEIVSTSK